MRFQSLFTPLAGVLFTFPSRYWFTIGHKRVFSLGRWSSRFHAGFLVPRATQDPASVRGSFRLRDFHPLWPAFPNRSTSCSSSYLCGPTTPRSVSLPRFGLFRVRSPLLAESLLFSSPPGTEMVHFPGFALSVLWIQTGVIRFFRMGFPHSEISGSMPACGSPKLFAACHVFLS